MTRSEFATAMAVIAAACSKGLSAEAMEVYQDLLGDLPLSVLKLAAKRVALENRYSVFPTVAEIRQAAIEVSRGQVGELSTAEAWALAWNAASKIDLEIPGSAECHCKELPPLVVEAMRAFGLPSLCQSADPVSVMRGQFLRIYDQLAARDRRVALLPDSMKREIACIGQAPAKILGNVLKELPS